MDPILTQQITELLTAQLGRAPTAAELEQGLVAPVTLALTHNTLNVTQSILAVTPDGDMTVQEAIDKVQLNGGGTVYLQAGTYLLTANITVPNNTRLVGVGSGGSILDFQGGAFQIQVIGTDTYLTGTVAVVHAATAVVGTGTTFDNTMVGRSIFLDRQWYEITVVTDATHLTIASGYLGDDLTMASCVIATPNTSAFLQGFTVQNSSLDAVKVQYAANFGGTDVASNTATTGITMDSIAICNWTVGFVDSCATGMSMSNMSGFTVSNTFLTNITSGGGYVLDNVTNSICINSSLDGVVGGGYVCTGCTNFGIDQVSVLNVTGNGFLLTDSGESFSITNGISFGCSGNGMSLVNSSQIQCATMQFSGNTGYGVSVDVNSTDNLFANDLYATNTAGAFNDLGTGTLIRSNIGLADN